MHGCELFIRTVQKAISCCDLFSALFTKDEASRRISEPSDGPLFSGQPEEGDLASGKIYVLRSKSDHPVVSANREVLHKIGVTGSKVESRIANARLDPTFFDGRC